MLELRRLQGRAQASRLVKRDLQQLQHLRLSLKQYAAVAAYTTCIRNTQDFFHYGYFLCASHFSIVFPMLTITQLAVVSTGNTVQAYLTTKNTQEIYMQSNINALSSRIFGVYTLIAAVIRLYAAYNIDNPQLYQLAICTFAVAWGHFISEWLIFKTAAWGRAIAGPVIISTGSLIWMFTQWGFYIQ